MFYFYQSMCQLKKRYKTVKTQNGYCNCKNTGGEQPKPFNN